MARAPVLLVACDYDGTLAPIVPSPRDARPLREAVIALRNLAALPHTHVAVISGRALRDLAQMIDAPPTMHLVGSHGSEFDPDFLQSLPPETHTLRDRIGREVADIARTTPGSTIEEKPASIAFHYRNADPDSAAAALHALRNGPARHPEVFVQHGKQVFELSVVASNKGKALKRVRAAVGASAVLFMGDDVTDETAFATLSGPDLAVKVGDGETLATHRVADSHAVATLLAQLCEKREAWLRGLGAVSIERHSMLSDHRTMAILTPDARVTWLCLPRVDSAPLFAELLGGQTAGFFAVRPIDDACPQGQRYVGDTFVLETSWAKMKVIDYLDCSGDRPPRRAGRTDLIRVIEGTGRAIIEFAPRLDAGRTPTRLRVHPSGLVLEAASDPIVLRSPGVEWRILPAGMHHSAVAEVDLAGKPLVLELRYGSGSFNETSMREADRRRRNSEYWANWSAGLSIPSMHPGAVQRSALILHALCYRPTGAILAAATTSLPEEIGGIRNWDYRFCWVRDAALAAASLARLGSTAPALRYLDWLLGIVDNCTSPERLRPVYTVTGGELSPEAEIGELTGYAGSRPVRVGNAASHQLQLDVFGPVLELIALLADRDEPLSGEHWRLVEALVSAVAQRWHEPDHGIWEVRTARQHFVHSKVNCWKTVDRAVRIASRLVDRRREDWIELRDAIAEDIFRHGVNKSTHAFNAAYESSFPDAATLHVGLSGLVPPDDDRFRATIRVVEEALRVGATVYRYRHDDGLPGREGGFHLCTSWLIQAYALVGRLDDARELLNEYVKLCGPTGLMSEEWCPETRRALGNFPQAYSHIGLIDAVLAIESHSQTR